MATNAVTLKDFDLNRFLTEMPEVNTGTAAPKLEPAPQPVRKPKVVPNRPRSKESLKKEAKRGVVMTVKVLCVSMVLLSLLGLYIYSKVVLENYNSDMAALTAEYKEAVSENVRLTSEVSSKFSVGNIAAYAEDQLGMIKKNDYQINYFRVD